MSKNIYKYWGKADKSGSCHLLIYHSLDVAAVGRIWFEQMPEFLKKSSIACGVSTKTFQELFLFFLSVHDSGKLSNCFQSKRPEIAQKLQGKHFVTEEGKRHDQKGYEFWSQVAPECWQKFWNFSDKERRASRDFLEIFARISFGHHGVPPQGCLSPTKEVDIFFEWMSCFKNLFLSADSLQEIKVFANFERQKRKPILKEMKLLSWKLAGIISICDWIASGDEAFIYCDDEIPLREYFASSCDKAKIAIKRAGVVPKKIATILGAKKIFPEIAKTLTPLQKYCDEVSVSDKPQLFILEDVTGSGKTEASLILASRIMEKGGGQGCFVALPTMATSNAMYKRMARAYHLIYEDGQKPSLVLAHGSRKLSEEFVASYSTNFEGLSSNGENHNEEFTDGEAHCSQWLADSSKKALLADVGVGTIDQVLLAGLPVKYQSLRAYGVSQKVLIVDEVHSFDAYMLRLLENIIELQASFGNSVILLSATLPFLVRSKFCNAFAKGLNENLPKLTELDAFPLATSFSRDKFVEQEIEPASFGHKDVQVEFRESIEDIYQVIEKAVSQGKCVCWIRNTITDVLEANDELKSRGMVKADVFHSRFSLKNRLDIEKRVIATFGKNSTEKERWGKVLIASQVVEQSLDLDFDLMVSDLAPVDLLIQRAGRLHRHRRKDRGKAVFYCLIPKETQAPSKDWFAEDFLRAKWVYRDVSLLWKTKEILKKQGKIKMPEEARLLVESVYNGNSEIDVPSVFEKSEELAWSDILAKKSMANFNSLNFEQGYARDSSTLGKWDDEERVPTRLSDKSIRVYLCRWIDNEIKPLFEEKHHKWEFSSLTLREKSVPKIEYKKGIEDAIVELQKQWRFKYNCQFLVFEDERMSLAGKIGSEKEVILKYDFSLGLIIKKVKN